jgi:hypothetical protein
MKLFSVTLSTVLVAILTTTATAQNFITNGLIAYYPLNGDANDASGHGNNANSVQATLSADRFGVANAAYRFNGINNYVGFAGVPTSQVDNWTVTAWVKPAVLPQAGIAVSLGFGLRS